ncbi:MAG: DUF4105 domain-containing protein, partial [Gemmatimonadota bacterium]|nr:DUF4105 domain-containing protein [Gemmatimonadota bacterium]
MMSHTILRMSFGMCMMGVALPAARAQIIPFVPAAPAGEPGSELTVYLLTIGQGEAVWELFGHNAIWIKDRSNGSDITYNWGMFDFAQPNFVGRFLTGNTSYWMEAIDLESMLRAYTQRNRSLLAQELNLSPAQRLLLKKSLEENARPENKFYRYDYYRDNCSTRLRDMLDRALGGQLQTATTTRLTSETYRSHTQRLTQSNTPVHTGVTFALGHPADRPISMWEEMFLPVRMANHLRTVRVSDSTDNKIPLVRSEMALFTAGRAPEPSSPPSYLPWFVAIGITLAGALIALVSRAEAGGRVALFAATMLATLWSLVAGLAGSALLAAWAFTHHYFMSWNENLLQLNPISIALAVLIPLSIYGLRGVTRARRLSAIVATLSLFGLIAQGTPFFRQLNGEIIALG